MSNNYNLIKKRFQHVVIEGDYYELGQQQGEIMKKTRPEHLEFYKSGNLNLKDLGFESFEDLQHRYEEICPGITDELAGLADSLGVKPEKLPMYCPPIYESGNCSQIAVLSSGTDTGDVYVARNYEYNQEMNDFRLCTARIKGKTKHIGFSEFLLFRDDGMNDHGFCVTFSGGGTFKTKPTKKGFSFFLIMRALLDNCRSVDEAINLIEQIPVHGFWNFLLTDRNSNAALVQFFDGDYAIQRIDPDASEPFLFSGNHYKIPEMEKYQEFAGDWILVNSKRRCDLIESILRKTHPQISKSTLRDLLSKELYAGLSGHYYSDYFGTLFSMVFDLTNLTVDVCFGSATHNDWKDPFQFEDSKGVEFYDAIFPDKSITLDKLWTFG
ncbi:MAG: C45 family autoproteolytic acyltransferase/hydrolase [Candidatus Thorarchaeota archaeon]